LAEIEEMRQREANMTALAAIGPRKQRRLDTSSTVVILLNQSINDFNSIAANMLDWLQ